MAAGSLVTPVMAAVRRRPALILGILLIVGTVGVFWPVRHNSFVNYDDDVYVYKNPQLRDGLTWESLRWASTAELTTDSSNADYWIPATFISHLLTVQLFGLNPGAHHLVNVALHALNAALLFLALWRMTGALGPSVFVAALFAVHPLHVESVAWVTERKDVLSGLFFMFTLLAYAWYAKRPALNRYLVVMLAFALGLMAKPMLVTLPGVLLLLDYWPLGRLSFTGEKGWNGSRAAWRLIWEKFPLVALAAVCSLITYLATHGRGAVLLEVSLPARIGNALVSYVSYIGLMLWPHNLAVFYPHPGPTLPVWQAAGAAVLLVGATALVVVMGRSRPYLPVGWFWYLGALLPVIGFVQVGGQAMADRYAYLPLTGLFIMVAWGVADLTAGWRHRDALLALVMAGVLTAMVGVTRLQVTYWRNGVTLFEHALAVTAPSYVVHEHLGNALAYQGRFGEALIQYAEALRIKPNDVSTLINMGDALAQLGRVEEAIARYTDVIRLRPGDAKVHNNLGNLYKARGRWQEAMQEYQTTLQLNPDLGEPHNNLGLVYKHLGRLEDAIREYQAAMERNPELLDARYNLGNAYLGQRRFEEAVREYQAVVRGMPSHLDAHNNLGGAYMALERWQEASEEFEHVLKLRPDAAAHYNLGLVSLRQGRIQHAKEHFGIALQLNPEYPAARQALQLLPP